MRDRYGRQDKWTGEGVQSARPGRAARRERRRVCLLWVMCSGIGLRWVVRDVPCPRTAPARPVVDSILRDRSSRHGRVNASDSSLETRGSCGCAGPALDPARRRVWQLSARRDRAERSLSPRSARRSRARTQCARQAHAQGQKAQASRPLGPDRMRNVWAVPWLGCVRRVGCRGFGSGFFLPLGGFLRVRH